MMHGGVMQMSHAAEKCGRRELAEYCLHFHHVAMLKMLSARDRQPLTYFIGNAVREGINKGSPFTVLTTRLYKAT